MKLIFVSNYFNHHQLPFCDALYELLEGDFCFLQTQPMEEERVKMGWQAEERPYVRYAAKNSCAHKSGVEKTPGSESNSNAVTDAEEFEKLLFTADVVIFGGCDEESYIQERLTAGKPIFRYNERLYKEGQWKAVSPRGLLQKYKDHTRYRKAPVYFLCAGAYVPCDYHLIHAYPGKMLRFGYFPETRHYEAGQPFNPQRSGQYSVGGPDDRLEASGAGGENSILFKRTSGRKYVSYYHDRRRGTGGRDASPGRGTRSDRRDHLPVFKARKKSGRPWKGQKSIWSPVTAKKAGGSGE